MKTTCLVVLLTLAAALSAHAQNPCVVPDNGAGTAEFPPLGCAYLTTGEVLRIVEGLPAGTELEITPVFYDFVCFSAPELKTTQVCSAPGGGLGGDQQQFDVTARLYIQGTGMLAGFGRILELALVAETHTAPRQPGQPAQQFATDLFSLDGSLFNDREFDFLRLRAGSNLLAPPSAGETDLTQQPSGDFQVDSFFDVTYQIEIVGAAGSALAGIDNTEETIASRVARIESFESPFPPAIFTDGFESGDLSSW